MTNYFKVWNPKLGQRQHEVFFFEDGSEASTRAAFERARFASRAWVDSRIAVWSSPTTPGPWDGVPAVGQRASERVLR